MLEALVYISVANQTTGDQDIQDILAASERNNPVEQLTGALIFSGSMFCQLLEGSSENLDHRMLRIAADNRHSAVEILARSPTENRQFSSWSMAYRLIEGLAADELYAQLGWDNTIKKLLGAISQQHSIQSLTLVFAAVLGELQS